MKQVRKNFSVKSQDQTGQEIKDKEPCHTRSMKTDFTWRKKQFLEGQYWIDKVTLDVNPLRYCADRVEISWRFPEFQRCKSSVASDDHIEGVIMLFDKLHSGKDSMYEEIGGYHRYHPSFWYVIRDAD